MIFLFLLLFFALFPLLLGLWLSLWLNLRLCFGTGIALASFGRKDGNVLALLISRFEMAKISCFALGTCTIGKEAAQHLFNSAADISALGFGNFVNLLRSGAAAFALD